MSMHRWFLVAVAATALATAAVAQPAAKDAVAAGELVTVTGKIEAVDQANRTVTVRGPMGRVVTLHADDRVKNFAQIKVGDELVLKYAEAVSVALKGAQGRSKTVATTGPVAAPAGAKPGVAGAKQTTIVASVERVDAAKSTVLLEGPSGRYAEVKVKDPKVIKDVKVGDTVEVVFTEAVLLEVVPARK